MERKWEETGRCRVCGHLEGSHRFKNNHLRGCKLKHCGCSQYKPRKMKKLEEDS